MGVKSQKITNALLKGASTIVTLCCRADNFYSVFLLRKVEDWHLKDPYNQPIENVWVIRDEIEQRVQDLLAHHEIGLEK